MWWHHRGLSHKLQWISDLDLTGVDGNERIDFCSGIIVQWEINTYRSGLVVRTVAFGPRGPGISPSSFQMILSFLGWLGKTENLFDVRALRKLTLVLLTGVPRHSLSSRSIVPIKLTLYHVLYFHQIKAWIQLSFATIPSNKTYSSNTLTFQAISYTSTNTLWWFRKLLYRTRLVHWMAALLVCANNFFWQNGTKKKTKTATFGSKLLSFAFVPSWWIRPSLNTDCPGANESHRERGLLVVRLKTRGRPALFGWWMSWMGSNKQIFFWNKIVEKKIFSDIFWRIFFLEATTERSLS